VSKTIVGVAASSGVAIGKAFLLANPHLQIETVSVEDPSSEIKRLTDALEQAKEDLREIRKGNGAGQGGNFSSPSPGPGRS
jgi:phosphotransferase system enzyme I (PtsI)